MGAPKGVRRQRVHDACRCRGDVVKAMGVAVGVVFPSGASCWTSVREGSTSRFCLNVHQVTARRLFCTITARWRFRTRIRERWGERRPRSEASGGFFTIRGTVAPGQYRIVMIPECLWSRAGVLGRPVCHHRRDCFPPAIMFFCDLMLPVGRRRRRSPACTASVSAVLVRVNDPLRISC